MHVTKHLIMLILLLLLSVARIETAGDRQLRLEIGLSKSTFLVAEPIWLDATLTNVSADTARIFGFWPPAQGDRFGIEIKDRQGKVLPHTGPRYNVVPGEGWTIKPQGQYYDCFNLLELFNTYRGLQSFFWQILPPGTYKVRANYENICSPEMEFEVVQPTEGEKEAYQLLEAAYTLLHESDSCAQKLRELISRFPKSAYAEKAHRELFLRSELVQRFPNSGYNALNLAILTRELSTKEKREFLQEVIRDHPETRSAKFAQEMLKGLKE